MNAPVRLKFDAPGGRVSVVVDSRTRTVSANGRVALRWDGDQLVMIAILAKAYPASVSRDRIMAKVFTGRRAHKDPPSALRQLFKRVRIKLRAIGLDIVYTPHPDSSDLAGHYRLGLREPDTRGVA